MKVVGFKVELIEYHLPWLLELVYEENGIRVIDTPRVFIDLMSLTAYVIQFPHGKSWAHEYRRTNE
jgi:hypothetical protein